MGNTIDKKGDANNQRISRMIRNFLKEGENSSDEKVKMQIKKITDGKSLKKSARLKEKNIFNASMMMAEQIIKISLFKSFNINSQIYNPMIVFNNIDESETSDENKISNILNFEENEELSNYCQLKSVNNLFFPPSIESKFTNSISKLFEDFKIPQQVVSTREDLKIENKSEDFPSCLKINNSPKKQDTSLEHVSLQEYLKRESERLKNDQDYLNYKSRKESLQLKEQREELMMNEILNMKTTALQGILFENVKKDKIKNRVNLIKNKKDEEKSKLEKDKLHFNGKKDSVVFNKNLKKMNSLKNFYFPDQKRNYSQIKLSNNNNLYNSPSNKSTSKSKFNITIANTCPDSNRVSKKGSVIPINFPSRNTSKIKINFSRKKGSNPISPTNMSMNIRENHTLTTKTTSRPSSYNRQNLKNIVPLSTKANKSENIFRIDLSRKSSVQINRNEERMNDRYDSGKTNDEDTLNVGKNLNLPVASIKIDIRELLQDDDDKSEDQSKEGVMNKSYSEILHYENGVNASNAWHDKELEDLIIVKQTVDKHGRIVIN
jgi:hypothetical protein